MAFKWRDSFSVNVTDIDNQHKRLFEIGSRVYDLASLNDDYDHYDEIMEILAELKDYTAYHFDYEEKLMAKYGYGDLESQQIEHSFFIKKLDRIGKKDIDGQQNETMIEMVNFVSNWISDHILKSDMSYKDFFNGRGVR